MRAATSDYPRWWDLATAAAFVVPDAAEVETGTWMVDESEPGRLRRTGDGRVRVVTELDRAALDAEYATVFGGSASANG